MNNPQAIEKQLDPGSDRLYFYFGGLATGMQVPPFAFYKMTQGLAGNRIYVRDLDQCWYHLGLRGVSDDIYSTAEWITTQIHQTGSKQVYFIGNSMGGFAAILFAALVGQGEAITFVPQTYLSPLLKLRYLNRQAYRQYLRLYRLSLLKPKVWNLRRLLLRCDHKPRIAIFFDKTHRTDRTHIEHLAGVPNVSVTNIDAGGHGLVRHLKKSNGLQQILAARAVARVN